MELREKFARILHSEYPQSARINPSKGGRLLRTAIWDEISEREKQEYFKVADRLIRHLLRMGSK